jgi:hypothetical protein
VSETNFDRCNAFSWSGVAASYVTPFFLVFIWICLDYLAAKPNSGQRALSLSNLGAEPDNRVDRRLGLVELRRMAAGLEDEARHGGGRAGLDGADLLQRPVLIVRALDEERGDTPAVDRILDVPGLEAGIEPGVVPAAEGDVDMGVIFGEPRPQVAGLIGMGRLRDRG